MPRYADTYWGSPQFAADVATYIGGMILAGKLRPIIEFTGLHGAEVMDKMQKPSDDPHSQNLLYYHVQNNAELTWRNIAIAKSGLLHFGLCRAAQSNAIAYMPSRVHGTNRHCLRLSYTHR